MLLAELIILLLILGSLASTTSDPCKNHTILDQPWRNSNCSETQCSGRWMDDGNLTEGWYRFSSHGNVKIPETTVPFFHCSTWSPGWLKDPHPDVGAGEVTRTICFNWVKDNPERDTCTKQMDITIKNCTAYFVYKLKPTPGLYSVYCTSYHWCEFVGVLDQVQWSKGLE
ncbi:pancreatic secretory granule membrane major glycoprotein GP2-like [Hemitrygon akajei]|uniref:pancreatic secretory granule membrane major glycoprotein GP2-like n=1 Tax=Hemitrygon akajei TaxID=2704970 RepID=UPI003BF9A5D3